MHVAARQLIPRSYHNKRQPSLDDCSNPIVVEKKKSLGQHIILRFTHYVADAFVGTMN